jgi:PEP-CTERM motif
MKRFAIAAASALVLGIAAPASAALITGTINFSGSAIFDVKNTTGSAVLDFAPTGGGTGDLLTADTVDGYFFTNLNITGFPPFTDIVLATIKDQTNDPAFAVGGVVLLPLDTPIGAAGVRFIDKFVDTAPAPTMVPNDLHFNLLFFPSQPGTPCVGGEAVGTSCTIGGFLLTQTVEGVRLNWDYIGQWVNGIDIGDYIGAFSGTLSGYTVQEVLDKLDAGTDIGCGDTKTENCIIGGNFQPILQQQPIPEPATLLLFGAGSGLLALRRRKAAGL